MKKIYIWGAGRYAKVVYETIDKNKCVIVGVIDKDCKKQGKQWEECIPIRSPEILNTEEFDYIFISVKNYQTVVAYCKELGIDDEKIVPFWKSVDNIPCIDTEKRRIVELEDQIDDLKNEVARCRWRMENYPYESGNVQAVSIRSAEELLREILAKKSSLCRFGDGELEIMRGKERLWYQEVNRSLSIRLKEILESDEDNIKIAVANNFGSLACYTENGADAIREYLSSGTREEVMSLLDDQRIYYDAYVSRPYMIFQDKSHAERIFGLFKEIWAGRDLLIVEGSNTKNGVGNDLFSGAGSIKRIICPDMNAFDHYDNILKSVCANVQEDDMVLITLGPVATVLAFDLARQGIQALDIGQLDNEYEWSLRGAAERIEIPGKGVSELVWCRQPGNVESDSTYEEQIVDRIIGE